LKYNPYEQRDFKRKMHRLKNGISAGPYNDLYIYHIKGLVTPGDEVIFGNNYIGNWVEDNYSFLFFSAASDGPVSSLLKNRFDLELMDDYRLSYEEWQGGGITTVKTGDFLITPPWENGENNRGEMRIIMDPGVVFGTGLHPTTRDCLKAISHAGKYYSFNKVLDMGTGTGILAIASARLGAMEVLAIDLNPLSVKTAKKNVKLNGLENVIKVAEGRAEDFLDESADLVIANIHYAVINKLLEHKEFLVKRYFIFSGLMRSQWREIKDMAAGHNLEILKEWDHEMTWYTFLARRD
jgi:ribosomal protein L11 methyltransferase